MTHPIPKTMINILGESFQLWLSSLRHVLLLAFILIIGCVLYVHPHLEHHGHVLLHKVVHSNPEHWYTIPLLSFICILFSAPMYLLINAVYRQQKPHLFNSLKQTLRYSPVLLLAFVFSAALTSLGFLALIVPGIILLVLLQFYLPVLMTEERHWWKGFKRCSDLVWGNWWRSAAIVSVPLLLYVALVKFIDALTAYLHISAIAQNLDTYHLAVMMLGSVFLIPLVFSTVLVQLNDLKARQHLPPTKIDRWLEYVFAFWK